MIKLKKILNEIVTNSDEERFKEINRLDDVQFLKVCWTLDVPTLQKFIEYLTECIKTDNYFNKHLRNSTKQLSINKNSSRILKLKDVIKNISMGKSIPDFARDN